MTERPTSSDQLMVAIDACRPVGDDLSNAELVELSELAALVNADEQVERLYHNIQQWDTRIAAQITESVNSTSVPKGLADRILDAIAAHAPADVDDARRIGQASHGLLGEVVPPATTHLADVLDGSEQSEQSKSLVRRPPSIGSRRLWLGAALAASLAGLAAFFLFWPTKPEALTAAQVHQQGEQWYDQLRGSDPTTWHKMDDVAWHALKPSDRIAPRPRRWQWLPDRVGSGIAYDLTPASSNKRVFLFVVERSTSVADLPFVPPGEPNTNSTEGHCLAAWQSKGVVYVLVVEGSRRQYRHIIVTREPQIA